MSTPPKRLPGDRGHLGRLLDLWARDTEELVTSGRLRRLVGVTAIIQMLDGLKDEEGREQIAFKGGAALELRFGFRARASNDLDGAYRGEVTEAIGLIDEAVRRGWSGFTGRTTEGEQIIGTGLAVAPVRFRVKLLYKEKDFVTVPMELSPVEGHSLDQLEVLPAAVSSRQSSSPRQRQFLSFPFATRWPRSSTPVRRIWARSVRTNGPATLPTSSSLRSWRLTTCRCLASETPASRSSDSVANIRGRRRSSRGRVGTTSGTGLSRPSGWTTRSPRRSHESRT